MCLISRNLDFSYLNYDNYVPPECVDDRGILLVIGHTQKVLWIHYRTQIEIT